MDASVSLYVPSGECASTDGATWTEEQAHKTFPCLQHLSLSGIVCRARAVGSAAAGGRARGGDRGARGARVLERVGAPAHARRPRYRRPPQPGAPHRHVSPDCVPVAFTGAALVSNACNKAWVLEVRLKSSGGALRLCCCCRWTERPWARRAWRKRRRAQPSRTCRLLLRCRCCGVGRSATSACDVLGKFFCARALGATAVKPVQATGTACCAALGLWETHAPHTHC